MPGHHRSDLLPVSITFLVAVGCISSGVVQMLDFTRILLGYIGLVIAFFGVVAAARWFFLVTKFHKRMSFGTRLPAAWTLRQDATPE